MVDSPKTRRMEDRVQVLTPGCILCQFCPRSLAWIFCFFCSYHMSSFKILVSLSQGGTKTKFERVYNVRIRTLHFGNRVRRVGAGDFSSRKNKKKKVRNHAPTFPFYEHHKLIIISTMCLTV